MLLWRNERVVCQKSLLHRQHTEMKWTVTGSVFFLPCAGARFFFFSFFIFVDVPELLKRRHEEMDCTMMTEQVNRSGRLENRGQSELTKKGSKKMKRETVQKTAATAVSEWPIPGTISSAGPPRGYGQNSPGVLSTYHWLAWQEPSVRTVLCSRHAC